MPLYLCGFLVLGAGIQHLNIAAVVLGWGIAEVAVMINTVAICKCPKLTGSTWLLMCWKTRTAMTVSPSARWVFSVHNERVELIADTSRSTREKLAR